MITLHYTLEKSDLAGLSRGHFRHVVLRSWFMRVAIALFGVSAVLGIVVGLRDGWGSDDLALAAGLPVVVVSLIWAYWFRPWRAARRSPAIGLAHSVTIDADGIAVETDLASNRLKWPLFTRFVETREGYLLYMGKRFTGFPRRAFASAGDEARFREMLKEHIPGA